MKIKAYKHSAIKTPIDDDLQKIVPYFQTDFVKQYIDIDITLDIETTDISMIECPSKLFYPNVGKYDSVIFIFEKGYFPSLGAQAVTTNAIKGLPTTYVSVDPLDDNVGFTWVSIVHEIIHQLTFIANEKNNIILSNYLDFPIIEGQVMPFWNNDKPYYPNGGYDQQLKTLAPYFPIIPKVTLIRTIKTNKETIGELRSSDGKFGCYTLELPWLNNQKNISCIPTGEYIVKWVHTLKFPLGVYQIQSVPNRDGIDLHSGTFYTDIAGCLILGSLPKDINNDGQLDLQNSRLIVKAFEKFMNKRSFKLIIKNI
jgi:hypothetical protein